jgi:hypothetical protein
MNTQVRRYVKDKEKYLLGYYVIYVTNRKVAGSGPDEVNYFYQVTQSFRPQ